MKKRTAFIFAGITALLGVYVGMNIKQDFDTALFLSAVIVLNTLLVISTTKNKSNLD